MIKDLVMKEHLFLSTDSILFPLIKIVSAMRSTLFCVQYTMSENEIKKDNFKDCN